MQLFIQAVRCLRDGDSLISTWRLLECYTDEGNSKPNQLPSRLQETAAGLHGPLVYHGSSEDLHASSNGHSNNHLMEQVSATSTPSV